MGRRVFLHIGTMKSATSYLQALCELNRDRLSAAGVLWCPGDVRYEAVKDLLRPDRQKTRATNIWPELAERIRRHPGDVVLSNEMLAALNVRRIRRLVGALPGVEPHIVITARDLARVMPSHWQTSIKNGRTWIWSEFASAVCSDDPEPDALPKHDPDLDPDPDPDPDQNPDLDPARAVSAHSWFWQRHDVAAIAARWRHVVPAEQITVVTVPAEASDRDSVSTRFASVFGVDVASWEQPPPRSNPSLGAHSVELMRQLNLPMADAGDRDPDHRFRRAFGGALAEQAALEPSFALGQDQQSWVRRRAQRMIGEIEHSGLNVVGDLADLLPEEIAQTGAVDPGDTTAAELLAANTRGLVAMADVYTQLLTERNDLLRQLHEPR